MLSDGLRPLQNSFLSDSRNPNTGFRLLKKGLFCKGLSLFKFRHLLRWLFLTG